jgi:hypothetical protein
MPSNNVIAQWPISDTHANLERLMHAMRIPMNQLVFQIYACRSNGQISNYFNKALQSRKISRNCRSLLHQWRIGFFQGTQDEAGFAVPDARDLVEFFP